jgi:hypothetical protein
MRWLQKLLVRFNYYTRRAEALPEGAVAAIREAVLTSPYMSVNNLNMRFSGTYGFSVVFRRDTLDQVLAAFPAFAPFLHLALRDDCNAYFLNPLLISDGAGVMPHHDFSLNTYVPEVPAPKAVSVLYVDVPAGMVGGALRLYQGDRLLRELTPRARALTTFRGDLRHEVTAVTAGAPTIYDARLSLVVEQYRLSDMQLAQVPAMHIGTRRPAGPVAQPLSGGVGEGAFGDALRELLAHD